jgi:hypothetical protein
MKRNPSGLKYRNLFARGGVIYYQRRVGGKRIRFSCKTDDRGKAASVAQLYEEKKGTWRPPPAAIGTATSARAGRSGASSTRSGLTRSGCPSFGRGGTRR